MGTIQIILKVELCGKHHKKAATPPLSHLFGTAFGGKYKWFWPHFFTI